MKNSKTMQKAFLQAFEMLASITKASKQINVSRRTIYNWLEADPEFKTAFEKRNEVVLGALEDEAVRRGFEGILKPVYQGGKKVGTVREYSDRMLELLLKARAPEKYKERFTNEIVGKNGKPLDLSQIVIFRLPDNGRDAYSKAK